MTPVEDPDDWDGIVGPLAEAGATWWIESMWDVAGEIETVRQRIHQGSPRVKQACSQCDCLRVDDKNCLRSMWTGTAWTPLYQQATNMLGGGQTRKRRAFNLCAAERIPGKDERWGLSGDKARFRMRLDRLAVLPTARPHLAHT